MSINDRIADLIKKEPVEMQSISIRILNKTLNEIDEIASEIGQTRSDIFTAFIDGGLDELKKQLGDEKKPNGQIDPDSTSDTLSRYFLLNTNFGNSKSDHYKMIEEGEASAFYNWRKEYIQQLRAGDHIFLYQSGYGVCGYGIASGDLVKRDHEGNKNECYSMKLNGFISGFKPITAKTCKDISNSNIVFRHTMILMSKEQGEAILSEINKRCPSGS